MPVLTPQRAPAEKYTKGVTSVESILLLDRLRQSVAVKEILQSAGRPLMRKTASVPNFSNVSIKLSFMPGVHSNTLPGEHPHIFKNTST